VPKKVIFHLYQMQNREARALRVGLLLAGQVGCMNLIVTGDCMEVISTMLNGGNFV
jgi:hypothetical protein